MSSCDWFAVAWTSEIPTWYFINSSTAAPALPRPSLRTVHYSRFNSTKSTNSCLQWRKLTDAPPPCCLRSNVNAEREANWTRKDCEAQARRDSLMLRIHSNFIPESRTQTAMEFTWVVASGWCQSVLSLRTQPVYGKKGMVVYRVLKSRVLSLCFNIE